MQVHTFIAESAADAIAQIRATLGPDAVVLNVRRPPVEGLARLWQKPRIEVLAHVPELPPTPAVAPEMFAALCEELREIRLKVDQARPAEMAAATLPVAPEPEAEFPRPALDPWPMSSDEIEFVAPAFPAMAGAGEGWRIGALLENSGVLPVHAQRIVEELRSQHGDAPPVELAQEMELAAQQLAALWRPAPDQLAGTHVFIGAPGAGKTTALCKWLAQTALVEGRPAQVWRLDGHVANTAESLSVYAEILGVPLERFVPDAPELHADEVLFVDLPGVNLADTAALEQLAAQIARLPNPQVHLVLNAAYETSLLLAQARAFARLSVTDLIVTHLDEEPRWGKLWNLVLGTNCSLRFLSAGQNIPGDFVAAAPERILARQFPRKSAVCVG